MMDQSVREKESLYQLQLNGIDDILKDFNVIDKGAVSYFDAEPQRSYLAEYGFETLPQLRGLLSEMWRYEEYMDSIMKTLLAAAMKNVPLKEECTAKPKEADRVMPEYIYAF